MMGTLGFHFVIFIGEATGQQDFNWCLMVEDAHVGDLCVYVLFCSAERVEKLVYTSSASVVFDGSDQKQLDETAPNPMKSLDAYTKVGEV